MKKIRLGDLLVQEGAITREQLDRALAEQRRTGYKLGRQLTELGYVSADRINEVLARQLDLPQVDLRRARIDPEVVRRLPETHARRFRAIVLDATDKGYLVGMADPTDLFAYDELARILNAPLRQAIVKESDILETLDAVYRRGGEIAELAEEAGDALEEDDTDLASLAGVEDEAADAPVVRLLQSIFEDAIQVAASDIHIEPDERLLRIRQRVDGVLQEYTTPEHRVAQALVLRLKVMAGLNISERRLPQDGRFQVRVKGHTVDVRLSTMPLQHGEGVVMRLLDQTAGVLELEELGMPAEMLGRFRRVLRHPHGLVLVTGPTGSGKTTTLYAGLRTLNDPGVKIITVEDPVEYRLPRVNQVQVRDNIGLTFARVLRSGLRHDPDIILVGEMRDTETVEIGLRAAITGHLVFSTLHTNDAETTVLRMLDMGAEPYLLAATVRAVVAQRLLRRICDACRSDYEPAESERVWLEAGFGERARGLALQQGRGCHHCNSTGYRGRIGVFELLELDREALDAVRRNDHAGFIAAVRRRSDRRSLSDEAFDYVAQGVTTLEELMRITGEVDLEPIPLAPGAEPPPEADEPAAEAAPTAPADQAQGREERRERSG